MRDYFLRTPAIETDRREGEWRGSGSLEIIAKLNYWVMKGSGSGSFMRERIAKKGHKAGWRQEENGCSRRGRKGKKNIIAS